MSKVRISTRFSLGAGNKRADAGRGGKTRLARSKSHARKGTGNTYFPCSAGHEQDYQPSSVDPYSAESTDHTGIHANIPYPVKFHIFFR